MNKQETKPGSRWSRVQALSGPAQPYGLALGVWLAALAARWAMNPWLGDHQPWFTFYLAVALVGWRAGWWPAIITAVLGLVTGIWFVLPPRGDVTVQHVLTWVQVLSYGGVASALLLLAGRARERQQRTDAAREALREEVQLLDLANVFVLDMAERITRWNSGSERLYGYKAEQALGRNSHELLQTTFSEPLEQVHAKLRAIGHWQGELSQRRADGQEVVVASEWVLQRDQNGQPRAILQANNDITERKRIERALQQARDELAQTNLELERKVEQRTARLRELVAELQHMSYSMVHEMRAPLRAIQGFAVLIGQESDCRLSPTGQEYLKRMVQATDRMDRLITDALNYNKVVREELPVGPVDTGALLHEILKGHPQFQAPAAEVALEGVFPRVLANTAGLTRCFAHLLENGVKFVAPGRPPRIRVWSEPRGRQVRIWFADNGVGIPKEAQQRIFVMFQQMHGGPQAGTGIGLALVRKVMEQMGGRVGVESQPGQGSRFWVELPVAETEVQWVQDLAA